MSLNDPLPSFDEMVEMHQRDPRQLEILRETLIQAAVDAAPPEMRPALLHTVFRMERARENANTPLESATAASLLMAESARHLHGALDHLQHEVAGQETAQVMLKLRAGPAEQG